MHEYRTTGPSDAQISRLLRALPKPEPPPWLYARVAAAISAEEQRRRAHRRYLFALATALQLLVFGIYERATR